MRYNKPRRNRFRGTDKGFRRNGSHDLRDVGINSSQKNFQRRHFNRNGLKAEKLLEKYNSLAKEALSNGDKILSESYFQHADHFLRIIEIKNSAQNNLKSNSDNSSTEVKSDNPSTEVKSDNKIILEDGKNSSSQILQNSEES